MATYRPYCALLFWVAFLLSTGLLVFLKGFFLTRTALSERSNCTSEPSQCTETRGRVVLLVVDALKFEFAEWRDDIDEKEVKYYQNKLPTVRKLLQEYPERTRLYLSVADAPTTTMQRIKAFTTGTLPTFIDIGSNFASEQINEDNIIDQNAGRVVFMGDDTWTSLFPEKFLRQFPSPSFNVWDLDTVDREVRNRIVFELPKRDWSLLIAHTLGVDHCGHKHGPQHPEMARKLTETDQLLREIIEHMDEDTVLIMMGDHGMTKTGDHGGDSQHEISTALFVHAKQPLVPPASTKLKTVFQIDVVPTISAILGTPVPFSNLGAVIVDALPGKNSSDWVSIVESNVRQARRYIDTYNTESLLLSESNLKKLNQQYGLTLETLKNLSDSENTTKFMNQADDWLRLLRSMCVEIWVNFNFFMMSLGIFIVICGLLFFLGLINPFSMQDLPTIFNSYSEFEALAAVVLCLTYQLWSPQILEECKYYMLVLMSLMFVAVSLFRFVKHWQRINFPTRPSYISIAALALATVGVFSNSYVVHEDKVFAFLLTTLVCLLIFNVITTPESEKRARGFKSGHSTRYMLVLGFVICMAIRLSSSFWRCREEQESCSQIFSKSDTLVSTNEKIELIISLVSLALYVTLARIWLRDSGNLTGLSLSTAVAKYCPGVMVVCMGSYWVLMRLPKATKVRFALAHQMNALPQIAYLCVVLAVLALFYRPMMIFLLQRRESVQVAPGEDPVPKLFDRVKSLFHRETDDEEIPIVYGLGTVYSAAFISLTVFLTLLHALLLGDSLAPTVVLMAIVCVALLVVHAVERFRSCQDVAELFHVPMESIVCWFFVAEYFFYATGHQPTFPTIHWNAAFVGTGGHYGNLIPAILIGFNTFGSHFIMAVGVPLLVIAPFSVHVMMPRLTRPMIHMQEELRRGELVLHDRNSMFHYALLKTMGKYMVVSGLRTFVCILAATIHHRHLMVWKIFAPKLIFEGLSMFMTFGGIMTSCLLVLRIDYCVNRLMTRMLKAT